MTTNKKNTNRKAKSFVIEELTKNGYLVEGPIENKEILVLSPKRNNFKIVVKGHKTRTWWDIKIEKSRNDLYYILVEMVNEPPRYYIFTSKKLMNKCSENLNAAIERRKRRGLPGKPPRAEGINLGVTEEYEDKWKSLPDWV